jgi:hypothetical protein
MNTKTLFKKKMKKNFFLLKKCVFLHPQILTVLNIKSYGNKNQITKTW